MENCNIINCLNKIKAKGLCKKHYSKQQYLLNKEKISVIGKEKYASNKSFKKEYSKQYYLLHKTKVDNRTKLYGLIHKEAAKKRNRKHYLLNKMAVLEKHKIYCRNKRKVDPIYKLRRVVSVAICSLLKNNGGSKNGESITKYLSYSIQELKEHLEKQFESWMNWKNHGRYDIESWNDNDQATWTWNIDHIIPQSSLPYSAMTDENFKKCWGLDNLRPYSSKQNLIDNARKQLLRGGI